MDKQRRIVVIGSLNFDIILEQQRLPRLGETYHVDRVTTGGGGKGANQAVQAAKLGVPTLMIGALGRDMYGEYIAANLERAGVDTSRILWTSEPTGLGVNNVLSDGSVFGNIVRGANYALNEDHLLAVEGEIARSSLAIFQMEIPVPVTEFGVELAKKHGCFVLLNAAPALPISEQAFRLVDCLIVNETEASFYAGRQVESLADALSACAVLQAKVGGMVIITLGAAGSVLYNGKEGVFVPARRVPAVDTTGAGDSYVGVFAAKLLEGISPEQAAVWATLAASLTVTQPGAQPAMPSASQLAELQASCSLQVVHL